MIQTQGLGLGAGGQEPCACRHRPLKGGQDTPVVPSLVGAGSGHRPLRFQRQFWKQLGTPVAVSSARAGQGAAVCWLFRTRCFPLSEHDQAIQGPRGAATGGGAGSVKPVAVGAAWAGQRLPEKGPPEMGALTAGFLARRKTFHFQRGEPPERTHQKSSNEVTNLPAQTPWPPSTQRGFPLANSAHERGWK